MKITKLSPENRPRAYALLRQAFQGSEYEVKLVEALHGNEAEIHEWVCIMVGKVVAYICFSKAYDGDAVCGLHLAPVAVNPEFQRRGIGSELIRFALRQQAIKEHPVFVLGEPEFYKTFGFTSCQNPVCPYDSGNGHFLSMHHLSTHSFTVGYEPEF